MGRSRAAEQPQDDGDLAAPDADYANRAILLDSMGRHEEALPDYDEALRLDREIASGPHWLTRFLRHQPEARPTVEDGALSVRRAGQAGTRAPVTVP